MEKINIAVTIDNKYALLCGTMLISLLENCSTPHLVNIYVISGKGKLSDSNKEKLKQCVVPRKGKISFIDFLLPSSIKLGEKSYYSEAIYYKLFAPRILRKLKRFLFMDSDMLVLGDISEVYFSDFKTNSIAGVLDQGPLICPSMINHYREVIGSLPYFNVGLLIFDTKKWFASGAEKKIADLIISKRFSLYEQDAFNYVFKNKALILAPKWNTFFTNPTFFFYHCFDKPTERGILHFQSPYKPFSSPRLLRYEFEYLPYLKKSPWKNEVPARLAQKLLHPFFCIYLLFLRTWIRNKHRIFGK